MEEGQEGYYDQGFSPGLDEWTIKIRSIEDRQNLIKDRLLLIGQNMIEFKEKISKDSLELKKDVESLKQEFERIKSFIETLSGEFSKFARKEDLEILTKQAKMFQPLEFVRKSDLK